MVGTLKTVIEMNMIIPRRSEIVFIYSALKWKTTAKPLSLWERIWCNRIIHTIIVSKIRLPISIPWLLRRGGIRSWRILIKRGGCQDPIDSWRMPPSSVLIRKSGLSLERGHNLKKRLLLDFKVLDISVIYQCEQQSDPETPMELNSSYQESLSGTPACPILILCDNP